MKRDSPDSPPSRLRRLSDEEIELWLSVASTVVRRPGATLPETLSEQPARKTSETGAVASIAPHAFVPKPKLRALAAVRLDRKVRQQLARGRLSADAAIDLHGLRQTEAHGALRHFLLNAQHKGARIVLVVTGKGGRRGDPFDISDGSVGILKRSVPHWLAQPDLRTIVIGFEEAAQPHGGSGALYVRLRRRDK